MVVVVVVAAAAAVVVVVVGVGGVVVGVVVVVAAAAVVVVVVAAAAVAVVVVVVVAGNRRRSRSSFPAIDTMTISISLAIGSQNFQVQLKSDVAVVSACFARLYKLLMLSNSLAALEACSCRAVEGWGRARGSRLFYCSCGWDLGAVHIFLLGRIASLGAFVRRCEEI